MSTYAFKTLGTNLVFTKDAEPTVNILTKPAVILQTNNIALSINGQLYLINATDTITLEGVNITGNLTQKYENLITNAFELFSLANSGNGGTGAIETAPDRQSVSNTTAKRLVYVDVDETKNNTKSLYIHTGEALLFLQTIDIGSAYILSSPAKTSAAVYSNDGTLIRTLWSGVDTPSGVNPVTWDGKTDDLTTDAPNGTYNIKVVANNINAIWEGVIGNTSDALTGNTVHKTFLPFQDMCIVNSDAYVCADFAERCGSVYKINLNDIQKKIDVQPERAYVQQTTTRICSDGIRLYMGGGETQSGAKTYVQAATFSNLMSYENYENFAGGTVNTFGVIYKACNIVDTSSRITGMAVQTSGNWLFVSRKLDNTLHVIHKINGTVAQTLTINNAGLLCIENDSLWIAKGTSLEKYTVNASTGALTSTGLIINGFTNVQGVAIKSGIIAIADAATNQQIKGYSTSSGALSWTLGQSSSYATDATILNDKFCFYNVRSQSDEFSFLAFESDGSLWVGDKCNYRYQKFNSSRVYVNQIAWLPHCWSSFVDPNNPSRVFADYLEYSVDYSKPLQAGNANASWTLIKNWGYSVPANKDNDHNRLREVTTLSNNRTYALQIGAVFNTWEVVELGLNNILRFTGVTIPRYEAYSLLKDGSIIGNRYSGGNAILEKKTLTGFDGSNNPQWSAFVTIGTTPDNSTDPKPYSIYERLPDVTNNNVIPIFRGDKSTGYHLGGLLLNGTGLKWKTAKTINQSYGSPYPENGAYDIGQNVNNAGSIALTIDNIILWGYNGEFWQNAQVNKWQLVKDNGLFLKTFGVVDADNTQQAAPMMAGNAFCPSLVKVNGNYYLWHNDESYHAGLHRWKIEGLNDLKEFNIPFTK